MDLFIFGQCKCLEGLLLLFHYLDYRLVVLSQFGLEPDCSVQVLDFLYAHILLLDGASLGLREHNP